MSNHYICVDLDGTLINTDLSFTAFFKVIQQNPLFIFLVPIWFMRGKCYLKQQFARRFHFDPTTLPYNLEVVDWLKQQKLQGKTLILMTGSHQKIADRVNAHLQLFDQVHGSTKVNLTGKNKLDHIQRVLQIRDFVYLGNHASDLVIWQHAKEAICVNAPARVVKKARRLANVVQVFSC